LGVAGAAAGVATFNAATGNTYIPDNYKDEHSLHLKREILENKKNQQMFSLTGNRKYDFMAKNTNMYGVLTNTNFDENNEEILLSLEETLRTVPSEDRPYLRSFANMTGGDRQEALEYLPTQYKALLKKYWGENNSTEVAELREQAGELLSEVPNNWVGYSPTVNLDDLEVTEMNNEGLNARSYGLGWDNDLFRMQYNKTASIGMRDFNKYKTDVDTGAVQRGITSFLHDATVVVVPSINNSVIVNVIVR